MLEYARNIFLGVAVANLISGGIVLAVGLGSFIFFTFVEGKVKPATEARVRNVVEAILIGLIVFYLTEVAIIPVTLYAVVAGPKKLFDVINRRLHRSVC